MRIEDLYLKQYVVTDRMCFFASTFTIFYDNFVSRWDIYRISLNAFLVAFKLHDEGFDVFALSLPVLNALLSVRIEVLFLLISQSLSLKSIRLLLLELSDGVLVLNVSLLLLEIVQLTCSLPFLFFLLLLSHLQLFVTHLPETGKLNLFLLDCVLLSLLSLYLKLATPLNSCLHLSFAQLLLLKESVSTVLCLSDLPVQSLFLVVLQRTELLNLTIDHFLPSLLLISKALLLTLLLQIFKHFTLHSEGLNLFFFLDFLEALCFFDLGELSVGFGQVRAHLSDLLLTLDFALLFSLQVLLSLSLDEFALEHLLLELFDEGEFEVFELLADVFCVGLLQLVLLLQLGAHLFIVLRHFLFLNLFPVLVNVFLDHLFATPHGLLGLLLVSHVAHQHFSLERLDHVLLLVHRQVRLFNLLSAQFVLVLLLLRVLLSALDLSHNLNEPT